MEKLIAAPKSTPDKKVAEDANVSWRQRLKDAAWASFRLLALAGFEDGADAAGAGKAAAKKAAAERKGTLSECIHPCRLHAGAHLRHSPSSLSCAELTKFQVSIIELTFSIIRHSTDIFLAAAVSANLQPSSSSQLEFDSSVVLVVPLCRKLPRRRLPTAPRRSAWSRLRLNRRAQLAAAVRILLVLHFLCLRLFPIVVCPRTCS